MPSERHVFERACPSCGERLPLIVPLIFIDNDLVCPHCRATLKLSGLGAFAISSCALWAVARFAVSICNPGVAAFVALAVACLVQIALFFLAAKWRVVPA